MLEVRFYGQLRRYGEDPRPDVLSRRRLPLDRVPTIRTLLDDLGIAAEDLGHIFLNGRLLETRATMALWLDYPDASERVPEDQTPLDVPLENGDRVALFGRDMALLVV